MIGSLRPMGKLEEFRFYFNFAAGKSKGDVD
jgi:hypothetical protein